MQNTLFSAMKVVSNETETTNGMAAFKSTNSKLVDLFYQGPSFRSTKQHYGFESLVLQSFINNKEDTVRLLFYLRDVREGAGERQVFRNAISILIKNNFIEDVYKILHHIPTYGRWDDLLYFYGTNDKINVKIAEIVLNQYSQDIQALESGGNNISLLGKWLPSCNTSSKNTRALATNVRKNIFKMSEKEYRKMLVRLRSVIKIVENNLTAKNYKNIDYSKLPSKALFNYRKAFLKNDCVNYMSYLEKVKNKEKKMNTSTLYPYDIVKKFLVNRQFITEAEEEYLNLAWKNLPNYFGEEAKHHNWLTVVDTSGSMVSAYGVSVRPIDVAISIGLYTAEHNQGIFKDKFITFSDKPELVELTKDTLKERIIEISKANWCMNTNITAVFRLILNSAKRFNVPPSEMPETVLIVSDMQFDCDYIKGTCLDIVEAEYETNGYKMPKLVFWNVAQHCTNNVPVLANNKNALLVSGAQPNSYNIILGSSSPEELIYSIINSDRYKNITL